MSKVYNEIKQIKYQGTIRDLDREGFSYSVTFEQNPGAKAVSQIDTSGTRLQAKGTTVIRH